MPRTPLLALAVGLIVAAGCRGGATPPDTDVHIPESDLRVLFIGNSLTLSNALPDLVQTIAAAAGHEMAYGGVVGGGMSLEDHWRDGVAVEAIRRERPDVVVLQQGPSSLPENQVHLRTWAARFDEVVREAGGRSALYMVWPPEDRLSAMDAVQVAHAAAADAVDGYLIPAGVAWTQAWQRDPALELYAGDDLHPSELGSILVALTAVRVLFDQSVTALPDTMLPPAPRFPQVRLDPADGAVLRAAAEAAATTWGRRPEDSSP